MPALVEAMFSHREVPWHGLGQIVAEAPSSKEALKLAGLDWEVEKRITAVWHEKGQKGFHEIKNLYANVRNSDEAVLGIVSGKYKIVQNSEAFAFVDDLLKLGDGKISYETAGSLRSGKRIWLLTKLDKIHLVGDETDLYLCFTNTFDGSGSVRAMVTPIRVVCMNTLNLAIKKAKRAWSCTHMGNIEGKLEDAKTSLSLFKSYTESLQEEAEKLQNIKINISETLKQIIKDSKNDSERILKQKEEDRSVIIELCKVPDLRKFSNSAWTLINAVSDYSFHRAPKRDSGTFQEKTWDKIISGNTLLDNAYEIIEKIA